MYAYITRQPVYNGKQEIIGYELLCRKTKRGKKAVRDDSVAIRRVLSDAVTLFGIPKITDKRQAFILFTRDLIMDDYPRMADPKEIVVEVQESVQMDEPLVDKLRELKKDGYILALANYSGDPRYDELLPLFHIIKVDFQATTGVMLKLLARTLSGCRAWLLAEKIETEKAFHRAEELGFQFFQGGYFGKPSRVSKQVPTLAASSYGMLMNEVMKPVVDYDTCCQVIQSDVVLTYMLLKHVQTVKYYRGNVINDIKRGLVMMGTEELRRWIWLVLMRQKNVSHSDDLPRMAYLRGKFIEGLMENSNNAPAKTEGFLLGMFSLLDKILGNKMETILQDLNLNPELKAALLGERENAFSDFYQYALIYEMGDDRLWYPDIHLRLSMDQVNELYNKCAAQTNAIFQKTGGRRR